MAWAGATAVICVSDMTEKLLAAKPPNLTWVALVKWPPLMVTEVPPEVGPELGLMLITLGRLARS
jgi:hypothetical protein